MSVPRILAVVLGLLNLSLWFGVVPMRNMYDALRDRLDMPMRPQFMFGVQELQVYFDPWAAIYLFPVVYTLGFVLMAWLLTSQIPGRGTSRTLTALLATLEAFWLLLIAWVIFLRGPRWDFWWPWDEWEPGKQWLVYWPDPKLSEWFWYHLSNGQFRQFRNEPWYLRELPGFAFLAGYVALVVMTALVAARRIGWLVPYVWTVSILGAISAVRYPIEFAAVICLLLLVAGYFIFRLGSRRKPEALQASGIPLCRFVAITALLGTASLVPLKMVLRWWLHWQYWITLPEFDISL